MFVIKSFINKFIEKIENSNMSFWEVASLIYIAIFIRTFIENFANSWNLDHMTGIIDTFFGYPAWFLIIFLTFFIIAKILTKEKITKIAKLVSVCSFVIITPPIIDLIINTGGQIPYSFINGSYLELWHSFITYFGGNTIGIGIKTEVFFVLMGLGYYIFYKTKNPGTSIWGMFLLYSTIFITLASPVFIFDIQNKFTNEYQKINGATTVDFYFNKEPKKTVTTKSLIMENVTEDGSFYSTPKQKIINQYSTTFAIIFFLINAVLLSYFLFLHSKKQFFAVLKNFRFLRILHYFLLITVGVYFGIEVLGKNPIGSLFDFVSLVSVFVALLFAWLFAVWENDEIDTQIDKVSNQDRPLVSINEIFSREEWRNLKYIFLLFSLGLAFLNGLYSLVFILLFIFIYHIYSTPPLHLKRFLGISSLLIAINALVAVWIGFFTVAGTENLKAFPAKYIFTILLIFLLVENVKNIKDIEGDKREGIKTIPVVFGEKRGKLIIGISIFWATLLVPIIFHLNLYTLCLGIFFGLILFWIVNREHFVEKYIFFTYFAYVIIFFILMNL